MHNCSNFASNYGLIRFIRFISRFTGKLCNVFFISSRFKSLCRCRQKKFGILNFPTKQELTVSWKKNPDILYWHTLAPHFLLCTVGMLPRMVRWDRRHMHFRHITRWRVDDDGYSASDEEFRVLCFSWSYPVNVCMHPCLDPLKTPTKTSLSITSPSHRNIKCNKWPMHGVLNKGK